jgi:nucleoside-diphosphate-sugar epimerase
MLNEVKYRSAVKNIIITGSNGMIGNLILQMCLQRNDVGTITSITRKPIGISHTKLKEVLHQDFLDFSSIKEHLQNQDICFYCVGVYTGQVPTEEFKKITVDYTRAFATALNENSTAVSFNFLSGQGADSTEKSKVLFAREKGIAENILKNLNFAAFHTYRPGYIYPVTKRVEPNFLYKVFRIIYKLVKFIYPDIGLTSNKLAEVMVHIGFNGSTITYLENKVMRKMEY